MTRAQFDAFVNALALRYVGIAYRWAGDDPMAGWDCNGIGQEMLASLGEDPPGDQTAQALFDYFNHPLAATRREGARAGALAFFGSSPRHITHVGFCISGDLMLEAGGGGSSTTSLDAAVKQNAYVRIRPIDRRKDLVAVLDLKYRIIKE